MLGDIRSASQVKEACRGADCVWHNAAAVGPYHPNELYTQVNAELQHVGGGHTDI